MKAQDFLQPGDILLYSSSGAVAWWIKFKTWDDCSHAEWYLGNGLSAGARGPGSEGGVGVRTFPTRFKGLSYILRPNMPCDIPQMQSFHESCTDEGYDTWGLVKVFYLRKDGADDKAYCSEHVARCFKVEHGGCGLFQKHYDCDKVTPGMLKSSRAVDLYTVDAEGNVSDVGEAAEVARVVAAA